MYAVIGNLGLWVRKLEGNSWDTFPDLKDTVEEKRVETSDTEIDECIKRPGFVTHFPEAVSAKYKWITDPFYADSPQNYGFSLAEEEIYIDVIPDTSSKTLS
jgi:hypothetical protein